MGTVKITAPDRSGPSSDSSGGNDRGGSLCTADDIFRRNRFGNSIADRIDATGDCWEWTGYKGQGYGRVTTSGGTVLVHRIVWEALVGPIPDGLEIDHLCRNRACCNPDHLETVPRAVNSRRGQTGWNSARKTHCPQGHPLSGSNLLPSAMLVGKRGCKTCHRESQQRYVDRQAHHLN